MIGMYDFYCKETNIKLKQNMSYEKKYCVCLNANINHFTYITTSSTNLFGMYLEPVMQI